ncbi:MAG TPA: YfiR family protein [Flavobacteriales bacterium]|nr:YfiR family protein [Flavobacteriales bacterium]
MILLVSLRSGFSQSKEQVYAGIIFHIMKYVEWPQHADINSMSVGVLNDNQLTAALNKVAAGKRIVFKNLEIVKFSDLANLKNTNVLFVPKKMTADLGNIMKNVNTKEILVISEKKSKGEEGAAINFVELQGKLRFELYTKVLSATDLKISEQLKRYAILKC